MYGNVKVSRSFVIPSISNWNQTLWGMPLGVRMSRIIANGNYRDYQSIFEAMGVKFKTMVRN